MIAYGLASLGTLLPASCCNLSEIINSRVVATVLLQLWAFPLLVALYTFSAQTSPWAYFAVVSLVTGFQYVHPVQVARASTNSSEVGTRMVSASLYNMSVQASRIVTANIYRERTDGMRSGDTAVQTNAGTTRPTDHGDEHRRLLFTYLFHRTTNKRRDRVWHGWTKEA
ncbi:uncharacterized protein BXZ73DRAFT_106254 [Epithele typhae]|uniref:uncharacterized protein n=1 Tax=Epithele typhae TaxID=378194 RepID=UPI0020079CDF|nr:uncharacterized protein BXZ73DRAFT_106254 [Epithele typhae]KAH9915282.1 hypothetical protein BXZ73DRAFT_106254 [Epithele typhae]